MGKSRLGFTIIEVSLFLAISALLFVGIAAGTGLNVARQRYNNAVEDYAEFLRRAYSSVEDVQNDRVNRGARKNCTVRESNTTNPGNPNSTEDTGRTECAVYGKIIIFNEADNDDGDEDKNNNAKIVTYDIIGDIIDNDHNLPSYITNTIDALSYVHAEFLAPEGSGSSCEVVTAGNTSSYLPDWSSHIENTKDRYWSGAVMIVRSPIDGSIHTYVLDLNDPYLRIFSLTEAINAIGCGNVTKLRTAHAYLNDYLKDSGSPRFKEEEVNFCVNSGDAYAYNGRRRNVRILKGGANSSAVVLVEFDSADNKCGS